MDVSWGRFGNVFSSIRAVLVSVGRFRPSLGPFWQWAVLAGSRKLLPFLNFLMNLESRHITLQTTKICVNVNKKNILNYLTVKKNRKY